MNMIAQSQSGTGKTAAFVCCMLTRVDASIKQPQVISYNFFRYQQFCNLVDQTVFCFLFSTHPTRITG